MEIRSGISEGDIVLLSPPPGWEPEAASDPESQIKAVDLGPDSAASSQRGDGERGERRGRREGRREGSSSSWGADGERPSAERMQEIMKNLTPEQREKMKAGREAWEGSRTGGGDQ